MSVIQPDPTNPELLPLLPVEKIIYDVESNTRFLADYKNMEQLLKREPELLSEYMALNVKARKNSIMIYLRKYNEKRALYLSEK